MDSQLLVRIKRARDLEGQYVAPQVDSQVESQFETLNLRVSSDGSSRKLGPILLGYFES